MKKVNGFSDYFIDETGKVFSNKRNKLHRLAPALTGHGYFTVTLYKNGKKSTRLIHRLVAKAFIPNPENKSEVNHKNGDQLDNRKENLEWATPSENQTHAYRILKRSSPWGGKTGKQHCCSKPVIQFTLEGVKVQEYASAREAAKKGFGYKNISQCCLGERKTHKGFKWRFK